jgi:hypothetical protein
MFMALALAPAATTICSTEQRGATYAKKLGISRVSVYRALAPVTRALPSRQSRLPRPRFAVTRAPNLTVLMPPRFRRSDVK